MENRKNVADAVNTKLRIIEKIKKIKLAKMDFIVFVKTVVMGKRNR